MLSKLFNLAASVVTDTARAPVDAYTVFKDANLNMFAKLGQKEVSDSSALDKACASVGAAGLSGTFTCGITTLSWLGLVGVGVTSLPVIGVAGVACGFAGSGLIGKLAAGGNDPIYAKTKKAWQELRN
jgi:hypothetical protein|tara:strand:+ start:495034 stop:495417 length:384 start_codon:yes stop_codon:yes gene_type:complete